MSKETTEVRKKQIIQATLNIIAEKGVSGLTTAEVAKRVGFSEAALFRHFPNKIEIMKAAMVYSHESLLHGIDAIINRDIGPLTKLEEILKFQLSYIDKNRGMPRIIFSDELHLGNRELRETILKRHQKYVQVIMTVIGEGVSAGIFRPDLDVKMAARAFFGMIQTAVFSSSLTEFNVGLEEQFVPISRFLRGCFVTRGCAAE